MEKDIKDNSKAVNRTALTVQQKCIIFFGAVLLFTVGGMLAYQIFRQDPVTVTVRNAQGQYNSEVVTSHPNETVKQVIAKTGFEVDDQNYVCDKDRNAKISDGWQTARTCRKDRRNHYGGRTGDQLFFRLEYRSGCFKRK